MSPLLACFSLRTPFPKSFRMILYLVLLASRIFVHMHGGIRGVMGKRLIPETMKQEILSHQLFSTLLKYNEDRQIADALIRGIAAHAKIEPQCVLEVLRTVVAEKEAGADKAFLSVTEEHQYWHSAPSAHGHA